MDKYRKLQALTYKFDSTNTTIAKQGSSYKLTAEIWTAYPSAWNLHDCEIRRIKQNNSHDKTMGNEQKQKSRYLQNVK